MRTSVLLSVLLFLSQCFAAPAPQSSPNAVGVVVPNKYIVVFKTENRVRSNEEHKAWVLGLMNGQFKDDETSVNFDYDFGTWQAYAITGPQALADAIAADADVDWVQPVRQIQTKAQNRNPPPGLRRISSRNLPAANAAYSFPDTAGAGVDVYIIDTGIKEDHPEFEGRAIFAASFVNNELVDGNGHGTHVAGTIGSRSFGVAPKATLLGVRVLDADGVGQSDAMLAGLNFVRTSAAQRRRPSVANMSFGSGPDRALDRVVNTMINSGITVVVAAGNDGADACGETPARVPAAITVGAMDPRNDVQAVFSNTGTCVDIVAPGVNIKSTWIGNSRVDGDNGITNTISGTSMACPHVAGVAALLLSQQNNLTPAQVTNVLLQSATPNVLRVRNRTPNLLLFNGGAAGFVAAANSAPATAPVADPTVPVADPTVPAATSETTAAAAPQPSQGNENNNNNDNNDNNNNRGSFADLLKQLFGIGN